MDELTEQFGLKNFDPDKCKLSCNLIDFKTVRYKSILAKAKVVKS